MLTKTKLTAFLLYALCFLSFSCSYKQDQLLFAGNKNKTDSLASKPLSAMGLTGYKIQPQDILQIRNLQNINAINGGATGSSASGGGGSNAAESLAFQVEEDSTVALPAIGHVKVAGLTRPQAAKLIEDIYRKNLLRDPIIDVKIINLKVTLFGEVSKQGNYQLLKDRTTLTEVLGEAGGLSDRADETHVKIIRGTGADQQVRYVNLRDINALSSPDIVLQNNDIVYVAQNRRAIRTEKLQNFSTIIQPALILMNTALIIYTLIHR